MLLSEGQNEKPTHLAKKVQAVLLEISSSVLGIMRDFKKLKVWLKAHQLVIEVYRITRGFPSDERF